MSRRPSRSEEGSALPLTIFFGCLCVVIVLGVAAVTSLYLERKRLFSLADATALAAAEAFELAEVLITPEGLRPVLRSPAVAAAAAGFLTETGSRGFEGLAIESAGSPEGRSASVTLSARWRPPVLALLLPEGIRIEVTALARAVFW